MFGFIRYIMRVNPIKYYTQLSASPLIMVQKYNYIMPLQTDTVEISFKGEDNNNVEQITPFTLKDYTHISGIHCPCCHTKMLTENEYTNILELASTINNGEDFLKLLNKYKDYIQPNMQLILSTPTRDKVKESEQNENKTTDDMHIFFRNARYYAFNAHKNAVYAAKKKMYQFTDSLKDKTQQQNFIEAIDKITNNDSRYTAISKVLTNIDNLQLKKNEKSELYDRFFSEMSETNQYLGIYKGDFMFRDMTNTEISKELAKRIFSCSVLKVSPISKFENFLPSPNNEVFICTKCDEKSGKQSFLTQNPERQKGLKENLKAYISDITFHMGRGDIERNYSYIPYFLYLTNKVSFDTVRYDDYFKNRLSSLMNVASRYNEFAPLMQDEVDIPCASCDTILMPHFVKVKFERDLSKCDKLSEYCNVLAKYDKYIGEHSRDLANEFYKLANENPQISENEFVETLRARMEPYYAAETADIIRDMEHCKQMQLDSCYPEFAKYFEKAILQIEDYIKQGKFKDYEFYQLHETCFSGILDDNTPSALRGLISRFRLLSYKSSLSKTGDRNAALDKDLYYTIAYNIMKPSIATIDRLVPISRDGKNSIDNYIGLCKPCNSILKSKSFIYHWYQRVFGVRLHMHKQLEIIDKMAKEGKIEGFDNWALSIAEKMYNQTFGKYDTRPKFKKD